MDMTLRSFIFAGAVLAVLGAAVAGWWLFDRFGPGAQDDPSGERITISDGYDDREGSIFDEFGQSPPTREGRITIRTGDDLFADGAPA